MRKDVVVHGTVMEDSVTELESRLKTIISIVESNPTLVSSDIVSKLFSALRTTEDNVLGARLQYNRSVAHYLDIYRSFPHRFVAEGLGFDYPEFFSNDIILMDAPRAETVDRQS